LALWCRPGLVVARRRKDQFLTYPSSMDAGRILGTGCWNQCDWNQPGSSVACRGTSTSNYRCSWGTVSASRQVSRWYVDMARRCRTSAADSRSGLAAVDVEPPGTGEGSCGSRWSAGSTDNPGSCLSRWCCSRSSSVRDHNAPEVSDQCYVGWVLWRLTCGRLRASLVATTILSSYTPSLIYSSHLTT